MITSTSACEDSESECSYHMMGGNSRMTHWESHCYGILKETTSSPTQRGGMFVIVE